MADIQYQCDDMRKGAEAIRKIANQYRTASKEFETEFLTAIAAWQGQSHERMQDFITGPVNDYLNRTIPDLIEAFAQLLEWNANTMESADEQIASSIPTAL